MWFGWLIAGLISALAPAQERRSHPGRIFDGGGEPLAGVEVLLVHAPRFCTELGGGDVQRVVSDENGRFVGSLRKDGCYWAFAAGVEPVAVVPGLETRLQRAEQRLRLRGDAADLVKIRGLDEWGKLAPAEVRFGVGTHGWVTRWEQIQASSVRRPPLMARGTRVLFRDAGGQVTAVLERSGTVASMRYPPPAVVIVEVVDAEDRPVEGAVVSRWISWREQSMGPWPGARRASVRVECGRTDSEGRMACVLPLQKLGLLRQPAVFVARTEDRVGIGEWRVPRVALGEDAPISDVRVQLAKGVRLVAKVDGLAEKAPAAVLARLEEPRGGGAGPTEYVFDVVLDRVDNGTFRSQLWPDTTTMRCAFLHADPGIATAREHGPVDRSPIWMHADEWQTLTFDLGDVVMVPLQVKDAGGAPCSSFELSAVPVVNGHLPCNDWLPVSSGDPAGRLVLPLAEGNWLVQVVGASGVAFETISVGKDPSATVLRLRPFEERVVKVVDEDGEPVAGATVMALPRGFRFGTPVERAIDMRIVEWNTAQGVIGRSDDEGRYRVRFVEPLAGSWFLQARAGNLEGQIELVGSGEEPVLVVR